VSRSAPQMAQPAAKGLTGSLQLGHRLRSGIVEQDRARRRSANRTFVGSNGAACAWACDAAYRAGW
jgi:hypothetical protein